MEIYRIFESCKILALSDLCCKPIKVLRSDHGKNTEVENSNDQMDTVNEYQIKSALGTSQQALEKIFPRKFWLDLHMELKF